MNTATIDTLAAVIDKLSAPDARFAQSLVDQHDQRGYLSERQWFWVRELLSRATTPPPAAKREKVGDMSGIARLFANARKHLKNPAIVMHAPGFGEVRLNVAGETSKVPGSVNVTTAGRFYDERVWLGRIHMTGDFEETRKPDVKIPQAVVEHLRRFAAQPAEVAAEYGKLTGNCCFCAKRLTDERSTAVGYGAKCAQNFSLPWGKPAKSMGASDLFAAVA